MGTSLSSSSMAASSSSLSSSRGRLRPCVVWASPAGVVADRTADGGAPKMDFCRSVDKRAPEGATVGATYVPRSFAIISELPLA